MRKIAILLLCLTLLGCAQKQSDRWSKAQELEQKGEHKEALKIATRALETSLEKLNPARRSNLTTAGQFGFDPQWLAEDILKITKSLSDNEKAELYAWRGFLYSIIGDYDMALKDYERSLDIDKNVGILALEVPTKRSVPYLKAITLWQAGKLKEAISELDLVVSYSPEFQGAYYYRGVIKAKLGDKNGSVADLEKAVSIGGRLPAQQMLAEVAGKSLSNEIISGSFIISFFANQPPLSRPYGYIWMIEQ